MRRLRAWSLTCGGGMQSIIVTTWVMRLREKYHQDGVGQRLYEEGLAMLHSFGKKGAWLGWRSSTCRCLRLFR